MAQRISRAKSTIKSVGRFHFVCPSSGEQKAHLRSVLHVLYLIFNEGYTSSDGAQLQRSDLAQRSDPADTSRPRRLPDDGDVKGCWR
jgi:predicted RNA polymerase sigma factor